MPLLLNCCLSSIHHLSHFHPHSQSASILPVWERCVSKVKTLAQICRLDHLAPCLAIQSYQCHTSSWVPSCGTHITLLKLILRYYKLDLCYLPSTISWGTPSLNASKVLWRASVPPQAFLGRCESISLVNLMQLDFLLLTCEACNFAVGYLYRYRTGLQEYCW
jgi:hypothetical protein